MNYAMTGQVALVTGASSGIGRATAIAFACQGAKVMVADVDFRHGEETVASIRSQGGKAVFQKCDVSSEDDIKAALHRLNNEFGGLDFAFNNAGIEGEQSMIEDCSTANFDRIMSTNLRGVWLCMKYEIPLMRRGGAIVNCSSIAGKVGYPQMAAYSASKHGILGLTKTAALELAEKGIRVNAVCPGVISTAMVDRFVAGDEKVSAQLAASEPMGRMGQPEEVAGSVLWLCSKDAAFVTGHSLAVDGGWLAR